MTQEHYMTIPVSEFEDLHAKIKRISEERDKLYAVVRVYAMLPGYGDAAREILEEMGLE